MNLTIALPSYNKEKYISRCIESILPQKKYLTRLLVVDNDSTDHTLDIVRKYPDVEWVKNDSNIGMSPNWNRCIDLCDTEWLMIVHADDELVPEALIYYEKLAMKYPSLGLIAANSYSIIENDETTKTRHVIEQNEFFKAGIEALNARMGACSAIMVKKSVYKELGYFIDKSLSSDVEMWHRIASKYDIGFIKEQTAVFRTNKTSTGIESLVKRDVYAIKADWDNLEHHMASHYPDDVSRKEFVEDCKERAVGSIFAITKANIRAGNYKKVWDSLVLISKEMHGLTRLFIIIFKIIQKRIQKYL